MNAIDIVREQIRAYENGIDHAVVTIVQAEGSTPRSNGKMLVYANGATLGTIGGGAVEHMAVLDALQCLREGRSAFRTYDLTSPASETGMTCGGRISVSIETFSTRPVLVMCGAGHVGSAVLRLASFVGFDTILIDDREEEMIEGAIALADRFIKVQDFEKDVADLQLPPGAHCVIATHGHAYDGEALSAILRKDMAYVGMIGSSKKIAALFAKMREKGYTQEELDRVFTPIGLDLGGETPEEIALSIMAEILMVKNGRTGAHLTGREK